MTDSTYTVFLYSLLACAIAAVVEYASFWPLAIGFLLALVLAAATYENKPDDD